MPESPTVSVVIPTYERSDPLRRAIESVRRQTWTDWEAIVVDDGSVAVDVADVVSGLGDPRVRTVRRCVNGGVAAAQNDGLQHARGRYVTFLHSDDEWAAERLEVMVEALDAAPSDVGGVECGSWVIEPATTWSIGPRLRGATDSDLLAYRAGVHIGTLVLRHDVADAIRFDDTLRHTEDRDFCIRLLRATRLGFVSQPLVVIHREGSGLRDGDKTASCAHLMEKYAADIEGDRRLHANWWARLGRLAVRPGNAEVARRGIRRAVALQPERVRWWPLRCASHLPDQLFLRAFRAHVAAARLRARVRSRQ